MVDSALYATPFCSMRLMVFLLALLALSAPALAQDQLRPTQRPANLGSAKEWCSEGAFGPRHCIRSDQFAPDLCRQIEAESRIHGLPPGFLARLLWQESRFDANAVSPKAARGIAQFIDSTAALRGLKDQFNPAESVEKSAEYLGEMTRRFGNVGLAAIGYNGGEGRAEGWISGRAGLPRETRNYVSIITGVSAEAWRDNPPNDASFALADGPFLPACETMAKARRVTPLAAPPPRFAPWGVQVGYGRNTADARRNFQRQTSSCPAQVSRARRELVPVSGRGPGRPTYVAIRLAADSRGGAIRLCRAIAAAGCRCRVFRNPS